MRGMNNMNTLVDPEKIDYIVFLLEAISGSLIEIVWIAKATFVIFIVLSAWKLVRK